MKAGEKRNWGSCCKLGRGVWVWTETNEYKGVRAPEGKWREWVGRKKDDKKRPVASKERIVLHLRLHFFLLYINFLFIFAGFVSFCAWFSFFSHFGFCHHVHPFASSCHFLDIGIIICEHFGMTAFVWCCYCDAAAAVAVAKIMQTMRVWKTKQRNMRERKRESERARASEQKGKNASYGHPFIPLLCHFYSMRIMYVCVVCKIFSVFVIIIVAVAVACVAGVAVFVVAMLFYVGAQPSNLF